MAILINVSYLVSKFIMCESHSSQTCLAISKSHNNNSSLSLHKEMQKIFKKPKKEKEEEEEEALAWRRDSTSFVLFKWSQYILLKERQD